MLTYETIQRFRKDEKGNPIEQVYDVKKIYDILRSLQSKDTVPSDIYILDSPTGKHWDDWSVVSTGDITICLSKEDQPPIKAIGMVLSRKEPLLPGGIMAIVLRVEQDAIYRFTGFFRGATIPRHSRLDGYLQDIHMCAQIAPTIVNLPIQVTLAKKREEKALISQEA